MMTTSQKVTTWSIGPGKQADEPPNPHRNRPIGPRVPKTAINDAIHNGASMHEVRKFSGQPDIRTTEVYFIRNVEDERSGAESLNRLLAAYQFPTLSDAVPGRSISQVAQDRPNRHRLS
jgi:hypothetical protein